MSTVIFLTFLFAVMETAFALYSYFFLAEAAREGARYAIVRGSTAGGGAACASYSSSNCQASAANIESYIQNLGFPGISASNMTRTRSGMVRLCIRFTLPLLAQPMQQPRKPRHSYRQIQLSSRCSIHTGPHLFHVELCFHDHLAVAGRSQPSTRTA